MHRALPARLLLEQGEAMQLLIDIEKGRRFVEQKQLRLLCQAGGQQHSLPFAST